MPLMDTRNSLDGSLAWQVEAHASGRFSLTLVEDRINPAWILSGVNRAHLEQLAAAVAAVLETQPQPQET